MTYKILIAKCARDEFQPDDEGQSTYNLFTQIAQTYKFILEREGHAVQTRNGIDFSLQKYHRNVDITLMHPSINHLQVLEELKRDYPQVGMLLLAQAHECYIFHDFEKEHTGIRVLCKPQNVITLLSKIDEVVTSARERKSRITVGK